MTPDPIVAEVHEARRHIMEECGNDIERLIDRLRQFDTKAARTREENRSQEIRAEPPQQPSGGVK